VHRQVAEIDQAASGHERAGDQRRRGPEPAHQPGRGRGDDDDAGRQRKEREAGPQRGVPLHFLEGVPLHLLEYSVTKKSTGSTALNCSSAARLAEVTPGSRKVRSNNGQCSRALHSGMRSSSSTAGSSMPSFAQSRTTADARSAA